MKPDGTVEVGDEAYRLVELASAHHFRIERVRDGATIGELTVPLEGRPETKPADAAAAPVVEAVADLLGAPRGLLPLQ
jgi:hypothetical protein